MNPNCPPEERYKSWQKIYPKAGTGIKGPHRMFVLPDGLRWRLSDHLVTGLRAADTQPTWFWDARRGKYVGYSREWVQFELGRRIRMASYNESPDLYTWSNPQIVLEPDAGDYAGEPRPMVGWSRMTLQGENLTAPQRRGGERPETTADKPDEDQVPPPGAPVDIYGPGVFPFEGVYVSLAARFHHWKREGSATWPATSDVPLSVSRDGLHFTKPSREPFLRTGMAGSFDSKWTWPLAHPVVMGDELWIYYYGTNQDHSGGLDAAAKSASSGIGRGAAFGWVRFGGF
jgi:hypothetical protein